MVVGTTFAQVEAEQAQLEQSLNKRKDEVAFQFTLHNRGRSPVKIESAISSCPCVQIVDCPKELAANEEATLGAVFTPNPIGGKQTQNLFVRVGGQKTPLVLTMNVTMPSLAEVEPKALYWAMNTEAVGQRLTLQVSSSLGVTVKDVFAMDENFQTKTTQMENGERKIIVVPVNMNITRPALIMIELAVAGRNEPLRIAVPCQIAQANPFHLDFKAPAQELRPDINRLQNTLEKTDLIMPPPPTVIEKISSP